MCRALFVLVGLAAWGPASAQTTIRGFVSDGEGGGPLPGANVAVQPLPSGALTGATADADGFYEVGPLRPGPYAVRISYVGYRAARDTVRLGDAPVLTLSVTLDPEGGELGEVTVTDEVGAIADGGVQTVRPADLARVPTPGGSGDLASYLVTLPGVVTTGDTGGQLYVRGGTPSQNLILVDGAPVFQPFHAVGFFSAFPEDVVGSVDLYAGGFGVRYNGRVSSVLDVTTRNGSTDRFAASAEAGPFLVGGRVEGPIRRGSSSYLVSARTSIIDAVAPVLLGRELGLAFSDVHAKLAQRGASGTCTGSLLWTRDRGRVDPERGDVFGWTNGVLGGRCLVAPTASPVRFETNASLTYVRNEAGHEVAPERTSDVYLINADVDLSRLTSFGRLRYGGFGRFVQTAYALGEQYVAVRAADETVVTAGSYVEAEAALPAGLRATGGLLLENRAYGGGVTLQPRARLAWRPLGDAGPGLDAATGVYRQSLLGISDERDAGSPFVVWTKPPVGAEETTATHALLGGTLPLGPVRVGVEAYAKRTNDQPVPILSSRARFTTTLTLADATARGVDVRVEARRRPFYGFLGYGYAEVEYEAADGDLGTFFGEPISRYAPPHDRRHQLSALGSFRRGRTSASVRWQVGSGLPYTQVIGFDDAVPPVGLPDVRTDAGTTRVLFDRPYNGRLPAFHRLDVSVGHEVPFSGGSLTLQAGAINAYDRANVFYFDVFRARRVDQLPLVPFVSAKLEVGP